MLQGKVCVPIARKEDKKCTIAGMTEVYKSDPGKSYLKQEIKFLETIAVVYLLEQS